MSALGVERSNLIKRSPKPVNINSLIRTINATNMPELDAIPRPEADIRKPPSRPPSCNGMKKSRLAKRLVKANINMHCM